MTRTRLMRAMALALVICALGAGTGALSITGQLLDYEKGYVFFTTGDGFRVAPDLRLRSYETGGPTALKPQARIYARSTFDAAGDVIELDLSRAPLPFAGDYAAAHKFAVALSPPVANPALVPKHGGGYCSNTVPGKLVPVTITVQVPPDTAPTDQVYMTTDVSAWNPQAYLLTRINAMQYRLVLQLLSGTVMHVLFDRGSTQSIQRGENGLQQSPYLLCVGDSTVQAYTRTIYHWGDEQHGNLSAPQAFPTPYNPAPFPNLPTPPPSP